MRIFHHLMPVVLCGLMVCHTAIAADNGADPNADTLRVGMIGLDTSHVIAFTKAINDPDAEGDLAKLTVTDAYPGGSEDIPSSRDRVEGFTEQLREMGVTMHDSIPEMLEHVDVVMLESVDGRPHLEQARPVIEAGKPLFIDKPLAGSLADAIAIAELAEEHGVPWFSSSSLRFSPGIIGMRLENDKTGRVTGVDAWGPCTIEPHHPDLFWYGVHGVEILFTIMGPGCEQVTRVHTDGTDHVTGVWSDGRVGTFRGIREGQRGYGAMVFGEEGIAPSGSYEGYLPLLKEIAKFFQTGEPPIDPAETLEIFAFMEAADESKRRGGEPVSIEEVMEKARAEAEERLEETDAPRAQRAYYYDTVTNELFVDSADKLPPITSPDGNEAVLAHYYTCGSCEEGERFLGYYEKLTEDIKEALEASGVGGLEFRKMMEHYDMGFIARLYSTDLDNWVVGSSRKGRQIVASIDNRCEEDDQLRYCSPGS